MRRTHRVVAASGVHLGAGVPHPHACEAAHDTLLHAPLHPAHVSREDEHEHEAADEHRQACMSGGRTMSDFGTG